MIDQRPVLDELDRIAARRERRIATVGFGVVLAALVALTVWCVVWLWQ